MTDFSLLFFIVFNYQTLQSFDPDKDYLGKIYNILQFKRSLNENKRKKTETRNLSFNSYTYTFIFKS